jgi:hypothetical protein
LGVADEGALQVGRRAPTVVYVPGSSRGRLEQPAETPFPILAAGDVMAIEKGVEASNLQAGEQFLGELAGVVSRTGDEDVQRVRRPL